MWSVQRRLLAFGTVWLVGCLSDPTTLAIGEAWRVTPRSALVLDTSPVGGVTEMSGVTYVGHVLPGLERFAAIQDEDARVVFFDVNLGSDAGLLGATAQSDLSLAHTSLDCEGIVYTGSDWESFWVSYERDTAPGTPNLPGVREYAWDTGEFLQEVALPTIWTTAGNTVTNRGFESLALNLDQTTMWTANEEALTIDGPLSNSTTGTTVRLQSLRMNENVATAGPQYAYEVEPVHTNGYAGQERSGLSGLAVLPDGTLIALERSVAALASPTYQSSLYQVDLSGATDISQLPGDGGLIGQSYTPVDKTELWSGAIGVSGQNLEGLALGPQLDSGNWVLIGVVDDGGIGSSNTVVSFELERLDLVLGDANGDGLVDPADLAILADYWLTSVTGGPTQADFDYSGFVDPADFSLLSANWLSLAAGGRQMTVVPEPETGRLFLGGIVLVAVIAARRWVEPKLGRTTTGIGDVGYSHAG